MKKLLALALIFLQASTCFATSPPSDQNIEYILNRVYNSTYNGLKISQLEGASILHVDGTRTAYPPSANTDVARGVAILAAQSAAVSTDQISVGPGTYFITSSLGKNGVNWLFAPGAIVTTTTFNLEVWDDGGGALSFSVGGYGEFTTSNAEAVRFTGSGIIYFDCKRIMSAGNGKAGVRRSGTVILYLTVTGVCGSTDYDAIWSDQNGMTYIDINTIDAGDNGVEGANVVGRVGDMVTDLECLNLYNTAVANAYDHRVCLTIDSMKTLNLTNSNSEAIAYAGTGYMYARITCQNMVGKGFILISDLDDAGNSDIVITGNVDASAYNSTKYTGPLSPIRIGTAGVTLNNLTLKQDSSVTYSVSYDGSASPSFTIDGSLTVQKPIDTANITRAGGGVMYDSSTGLLSSLKTIIPFTNDGAALGTTSFKFSDLFLASGAVININSGDITQTHSANTLDIASTSATATIEKLTQATGYAQLQVNGNTGSFVSLGAANSTIDHSATSGSLKIASTESGVGRHERITLYPESETVFNEEGRSQYNVRMETDNNANMVVVDAVNDTVSLGTLLRVTTAGKVSHYGNVATAGWGIPSIYGSGRATAQTSRSAALATYTVGAADGSFEVSGNVLVTTSTIHSFSLDVSYTDEGNTARTLILPMAQLAGTFLAGGLITNTSGAGPYESPVMHIRCKAATAITIRPSNGTFTTVTYNADGLIKQTA